MSLRLAGPDGETLSQIKQTDKEMSNTNEAVSICLAPAYILNASHGC